MPGGTRPSNPGRGTAVNAITSPPLAPSRARPRCRPRRADARILPGRDDVEAPPHIRPGRAGGYSHTAGYGDCIGTATRCRADQSWSSKAYAIDSVVLTGTHRNSASHTLPLVS